MNCRPLHHSAGRDPPITASVANKAYNPANYLNHAGGIFFIGYEANGSVYAYALNHTTSTFTRVATFSTGFPAAGLPA